MTSSTIVRPTFSERYCQQFGVSEDQFCANLLGRSLHAPLRWIYPLFRRSFMDYLEPDVICVRAAGRMTRRRELEGELSEFSYHPRNRSFARRILKQRLSTHRVRRIFRDLPDE